ncbi:MAG: hypothetical protein ACR2LD_06925 [Actinomycetota bacterium]
MMVRGVARVEPVGEASAHLATRYEHYALHPPEDEAIVLDPRRILWWTWQ